MSISKLLGFDWSIHGDGRTVKPGSVVAPSERLAWPITIGIGAQHVVAMFGATFLVPLLTGFPPATTLFFSGIGTVLFLLITRGRVPSYLGSSFAFIAPLAAAMNSHGPAGALLRGLRADPPGGLLLRQAGPGPARGRLPGHGARRGHRPVLLRAHAVGHCRRRPPRPARVLGPGGDYHPRGRLQRVPLRPGAP